MSDEPATPASRVVRHARRRLRGRLASSMALTGVAALAVTLLTAPPAAAFSANEFQMPFACGEQWNGATRDNHPTGSGTHLALDFNKGSGSADYGLPVVASAAGKVVKVGGGYGDVVIDHGQGWQTTYRHLSSYAVSNGAVVTQGQRVGAVGGRGPDGPLQYSPHLHYEQRQNRVLKHIRFDGSAVKYVKQYNGPLFTSKNCPASSPVPPPGGSSPRVTEDFTGDGIADLIAVDQAGTLFLYPGLGRVSGESAYGQKFQVGQGWKGMTSLASPGDLTGDGLADLIATSAAGDLMIYPGIGSLNATGQAFRTAIKVGHGWSGFTNLTGVGDMTGDGKPDVVATDAEGRLWLYPGRGLVRSSDNSAFGSRVQIGVGWQGMRHLTGAGDLNGDGHPDLVAVDSQGKLMFYAGLGKVTGGNAVRAAVQVGTGWSSFTHLTVPGDVNGDNTFDLVAVDGQGTLRLYPGLGRVTANNAFGASVPIGQGWSGFRMLAD